MADKVATVFVVVKITITNTLKINYHFAIRSSIHKK